MGGGGAGAGAKITYSISTSQFRHHMAGMRPPDISSDHCTALYCIILWLSVLHCTALYCTVLRYSVLLCAVLGQCLGPHRWTPL